MHFQWDQVIFNIPEKYLAVHSKQKDFKLFFYLKTGGNKPQFIVNNHLVLM